jgi:hypothetical protein
MLALKIRRYLEQAWCPWRIAILAVPRMIKKLEQIEIPDLIAQSSVIKRTSPNRAKATLHNVTSERNFTCPWRIDISSLAMKKADFTVKYVLQFAHGPW